MKKRMYVLSAILLAVVIGTGWGVTRVFADEKTFHRSAGTLQSFGKAAFTFGVKDLKQDGDVVYFTIPENARELDDKADAVEVSGLYDLARDKPSECPLAESTEVSKTVEHYDMMSGKATVKAKFDDPKIAAVAIKRGCLLIHDVD